MQKIRNFEDLSLLDYDPKYCSPERGLLAEVIYRAMRDVLNPALCEEDHIRREAILWMRLERKKFLKRDAKSPYSFVWCCNHLELCPYRVREKIIELRKNGVKLIV